MSKKPVDFEKSNTQLGQNSSDQTLQTKTELEKSMEMKKTLNKEMKKVDIYQILTRKYSQKNRTDGSNELRSAL